METFKDTCWKIFSKLDRSLCRMSVASALKGRIPDYIWNPDFIWIDDPKQYIMKREVARVKLNELYGNNNVNKLLKFSEYNINCYELRNIVQRLRRIKWEKPDCDEIEDEIKSYLAVKGLFRIHTYKLDNKLDWTWSELYNTVNDAYNEVEKIYLECYSNLSEDYKSNFEYSLSNLAVREVNEIKRVLVMIYILKRDELLNQESWKNTCDYMMWEVISAAYNWAFWYCFRYNEMLSKFWIQKEEIQDLLKYIDLV